MKFYSVVFVVLLGVTLSAAANAEFYEYTDESGVVRFTDDPSLIPEDQREGAKTIESVKSAYVPEDVPQQTEKSAPEVAETSPEAGKAPGGEPYPSEMRKEADELNAVKEGLLQEFNALQAEKEALGPPPAENAKSGEKADYTFKVTDYNRKVDAYQQRAKEFDEKVNDFNSRIMNK